MIALGGGAFIDAENRDRAEQTGLTVWLKVSFTKLADRVKMDGTRPKFGALDEVRQLFESREPYYAMAKLHISTDDGTPDSVADQILGVFHKT